jgi:RNA polymerase sigma-70 factor (ECF subfamily)
MSEPLKLVVASGSDDDEPGRPDPRVSPSDAELMARIVADDAGAFRQLVLRHEAGIRGHLRQVVGAEADDLVQEVFTTLWLKRHRYQERGLARAYLFRLARLRALKHLRWRQVRNIFAERAHTPEPSTTSEPLTRVLAREERVALHAALAQLTAAERALVHLRFVEALSYAELEAVLGKTEAALRQQSRRILLRLKQHLPEE